MIKNKKAKIIFTILYLIISYTCLFLGIHYVYLLRYTNDLLIIFTIADIFVLLHFLINIKKIYNFIYEKRYLLGFALLMFLVIGKYNGSSIMSYNDVIQSEYRVNNSIILGIERQIRSDEWVVGTPSNLSQQYTNYSSINNLLSAKDNLVTLNPKLPNKNIFSLLSSPNTIGYLFLDTERAYSLAWYLPYFILAFATFELFMIMTKKNKLYSLLGTILITLSAVVQWWQNATIIGYGALAIDLFYYFILAKSRWQKLLLSLVFGYVGYLYIMCLYPAWQVPYGYCYLIIMLFLIIKNKDKLKWKDLLYSIPAIALIAGLIIPLLISNKEVFAITTNTVYPGARISTGGGEFKLLFTYVNSVFYPYTKIDNPCELSQYISLFPIPIFYSIYLMFKNKKIDWFLLLSVIVLTVLTLWTSLPLGEFFSKITLLYMSTEVRCQVAIGYLSVIIIIYIISNYENDLKLSLNKKNIILFIISIILSIITVLISRDYTNNLYPNVISNYVYIFIAIIYIVVIYMFILNNKKTNLLLTYLLIFISFASGIIVSPINKGLSILYDKPIAKEIKKIVNNDKDAKFLIVDSESAQNNYLLASGARIINSVNYLPDLDLYYKLDPEHIYEEVYNRYAHVDVSLVNEKTSFNLIQVDHISINLSYDDICLTGADYLISYNREKEYSNYDIIYNEYGAKIIKTNCEG